LFVDLGTARPRAFAQRHGQVRRRDVAVVRVVQRADDGRCLVVAEIDEGPEFLHPLRRDHLEGHADGVGGAAVLLIFIHAFAAGRQAQVAGHMEADILAGFRRQPLVQIHRILVQLPDGVAHVE